MPVTNVRGFAPTYWGNMMREIDITFYNRQQTALAGVLCLGSPVGTSSPAVLLCQGFSGVKHLVLPEVAAGLAQRGIASLRFDYSGFGESEGQRGWMDPRARVDDALSAFAWLAQHDDVDASRLGVYGHSFGGPVAICLGARELRVRAVVSVSGPGSGTAMLQSMRTSWDWVAFKDRVEAARATAATTGETTEVGINDIIPFSPEFFAAFEQLKADGGTSGLEAGSDANANRFTLASVDAMVDFHPEDAARRLGGRPLLLIHGAEDDTVAIETVEPVFANASGPKRWVIIPDAAHIDLDAGPGLARAITLAADWFSEHTRS